MQHAPAFLDLALEVDRKVQRLFVGVLEIVATITGLESGAVLTDTVSFALGDITDDQVLNERPVVDDRQRLVGVWVALVAHQPLTA